MTPYLVIVVKQNGHPYEHAVPRRVDAENVAQALEQSFGAGPPSGREAHTALVFELADPVVLTQVPIEAHAPTWGTPRRHNPQSSSSAVGSR